MIDNFMLNERIAEKRCEMDHRAAQAQLVRLARDDDARDSGLRAAVASGIVRVALLVDANAGRRAATPRQACGAAGAEMR